MSNTINTVNAQMIDELFTLTFNEIEKISKDLSVDLPHATTESTSPSGDLPVLPAPTGRLSLETLLDAIGFENRRIACKNGVENLEAKAEEQKEIGEKELQELQKQLDKMKEQKVLNGFLKAFKVIGVIVGAVASAFSIAAGALTGNPLLIAAGAIGIAMTVDSVVSLASDGKYSLSKGFEELGKAMGMDDDAAQKFAFGMQMLITVASVALSFGAAFAGSGANAAANAAGNIDKAMKLVNTSQRALNITNGVIATAEGSGQIASSVINYQAEKCNVNKKELEAILERIRNSIEFEKSIVEAEMERSNQLLDKVSDIVQDQNATAQAILTITPNYA